VTCVPVDDVPGPDARRRTNPRPGRRVPGTFVFLRLAARTAPYGAREIVNAPREGAVGAIRGAKRSLLVTFKRDGTPVPTPAWAAESGGRLYVRTERVAGKVKRLRRDPRMLVAPCTVRGRPLGPPFEATARVLPHDDEPIAERALRGRYGVGRATFELAMDLARVDMCYLEIKPAAWGGPQAGSR
jgi:uncharacterized protein